MGASSLESHAALAAASFMKGARARSAPLTGARWSACTSNARLAIKQGSIGLGRLSAPKSGEVGHARGGSEAPLILALRSSTDLLSGLC